MGWLVVRGEIIGLVPARGGSRGIPRKNIALLAGRPLLAYTADAAGASRLLDRTLLSTDDPEIAAAGRDLGLEVPFTRPAQLARDDTPMVEVLRHAVGWLDGQGVTVAAVVLLQPTSPLRRAVHIDAAIDLRVRSGAATVVSVVHVPHNFHPLSLLRRDGDRLVPYLADRPTVTDRHKKPTLFARNGPAVVVTAAELVRAGTLYGDPTVGYEMTRADSFDIDDPEDLEVVETIIRARDA